VTAARRAGAAAVLAGPFVLAFVAGGYFAEERMWAALAACALLALAAVVAPLPRSAPAWAATGALAALAAWTVASGSWAPLSEPAAADAQRLVLYALALPAATLLLAGRLRAVEPALALGCLAVVGYGLSERLLPGLIDLEASRTAAGRLEQPLTYWNAMGAIAAVGLVLCARLAGDGERAAGWRAAGAAIAVPLTAGLVLAFSRGALAAAALGLALLCWTTPSLAQLRAVGIVLMTGGAGALAASVPDGVRALEGSAGDRELEGAVVLAVLVALMAVAAWAARLPVPRRVLARPRAVVVGLGVAVLLGALALAQALEEGPPVATPAMGATASRLASTESNRYAYWSVALDMFAEHPLRGAGTGAFVVDWRRERHVRDPARDAHSLYLETAAELGLVGLALLAALIGAVAVGARRAWRAAPGAAAGVIAALAAWAAHAAIDWDWEMPAVALLALVLAAALLAVRTPEPAG